MQRERQQLPSQIAPTKKYIAYRTISSCFEESLAEVSENFDTIKFDTTHIHNIGNEDSDTFNIEVEEFVGPAEEVIADTEEVTLEIHTYYPELAYSEDTDPVDQDQLDEDEFKEREPVSLLEALALQWL
ncbi:hypothetical protein BDZ91DRAFT_732477 [Kalaharituber pfeilii]|nr:hypothetical protein BDZ91DRAFT_732477 [Kalaharituber pfeilii]